MFGQHELAVVQRSDAVEDGGGEGEDGTAGAIDVGTSAVSRSSKSTGPCQSRVLH